jgi:hypothetical protein
LKGSSSVTTAEQTATGLGDPIITHRARAATRGEWTYRHPIALLPSVDRNEYLVEIARDRRVIHVGCATEGETDGQFHAGRLLFAQLEAVAAAQLGVDPDAAGMQRLSQLVRPSWTLQTCLLGQVSRDVLDEFRPEIVLVPETVEHVPDAGSLLHDCAQIASRYGADVVITVPNALSADAIVSWAEGVEFVHPDHVAAYTPRTLQTLIEKSDLRPVSMRPYTWGPPPRPIPAHTALKVLWRTRGSLYHRALRAAREAFAHRFPDGWIATAVARDAGATLA